MQERSKTCCFTGHRPNRLPWLADPCDLRTKALKQALWQRILSSYEQGYTCFLSGMALGVDLICARLVLELAETEREVQLVAVVPYPAQAARWSAADRREYQAVLHSCGERIVVVSPSYHRQCFALRNRYLVDHARRIIGVYDGAPSGGTFQTLEYARKQGLEMELLVPE